MAQLRFTDLTAARQSFIRQCQRLGFGTVRGLEVRDCEPVFGPKTEVLVDLKLDSDDTPRPEQHLGDFVLPDEVRRLFAVLDTLRNGTVEQVEVRSGVPRRLFFRSTDSMHG